MAPLLAIRLEPVSCTFYEVIFSLPYTRARSSTYGRYRSGCRTHHSVMVGSDTSYLSVTLTHSTAAAAGYPFSPAHPLSI